MVIYTYDLLVTINVLRFIFQLKDFVSSSDGNTSQQHSIYNITGLDQLQYHIQQHQQRRQQQQQQENCHYLQQQQQDHELQQFPEREELLLREIRQMRLMKQMMETMLQHQRGQPPTGTHLYNQEIVRCQMVDDVYNVNRPLPATQNGANDVSQQMVLDGLKKLEVN